MLDNWDSQDFHLLPQVQEHRSSTSVGSWRGSTHGSSDVDMIGPGGIPSDDDEVEHKEVATRAVMNKNSASGGVHFRVSATFIS